MSCNIGLSASTLRDPGIRDLEPEFDVVLENAVCRWRDPTGSIRIRVETIGCFLRRYREDVIRKRKDAEGIEQQPAELETQLRREQGMVSDADTEVFAENEGTRELQDMAGD